KVRQAIAVGKRSVVSEPVQVETNGFKRLGRTLSAFNETVVQVNDTVNRNRAVRLALAPTEIATARERSVFNQMLEVARRKVEIAEWLGDDPNKLKMYQESLADLEAITGPEKQEPIHIEPVHLSPPEPTGHAD